MKNGILKINQKIKKLLENYEKEIEKRRKNNGVNDFRNFSRNTAVNSLNSSISNPPPYSLLPPPPTPPPLPYSPPLTPTPPISNQLNYDDDTGNENGDLAIVLFKHVGNTSNELTIDKNEYLIVTNWDIGDGYAYGYKRNDPQQKGKFPSPLVRKYTENTVRNSRNTTPINANQMHLLQMNRLSVLSESSSRLSISSSPSIVRSIQQQRPTAPLENRFSMLSEDSSHLSISSSPSTISSVQPRPTAPLETSLNRVRINNPYMYNNRYFENNQIESKRYHYFRDDI